MPYPINNRGTTCKGLFLQLKLVLGRILLPFHNTSLVFEVFRIHYKHHLRRQSCIIRSWFTLSHCSCVKFDSLLMSRLSNTVGHGSAANKIEVPFFGITFSYRCFLVCQNFIYDCCENEGSSRMPTGHVQSYYSRSSPRSESSTSSSASTKKAVVSSTVIPSSRLQRSDHRFRKAFNTYDDRELPVNLRHLLSNELFGQNGTKSNRCNSKSTFVEPERIKIPICPKSLTIRNGQNIVAPLFLEESVSRSKNPKCVRFFHFNSGALRHTRRSTRNKVMRDDTNNEDCPDFILPRKDSESFSNPLANIEDYDAIIKTSNNSFGMQK